MSVRRFPREKFRQAKTYLQIRGRAYTERNALLLRAELRCRAGFGTLGRPVFGRKGYAPEGGAWRSKFHTNLRLAAAHGTQKRHVALLLLFRLVVLHVDHGAADHARIEQYQRAMRIDGESLAHFLEILALGVLAANPDAHLHEHALAPAADPGMCGWCRNLVHANPRSI